MKTIITGHEAEMAGLAEQAASSEYRAHCLAMAVQTIEENQAILAQAEAGTLQPYMTIFEEVESVESQVRWAQENIALYASKLAQLQADAAAAASTGE